MRSDIVVHAAIDVRDLNVEGVDHCAGRHPSSLGATLIGGSRVVGVRQWTP
jgi:hypothetical protein